VTIATEKSGDTLTVKLDGRLDATTAPQLDAKLDLDGVRELVLDFGACHYISSARPWPKRRARWW
jgi:anti-sigma B factor antagonist